jgi:hypothetical protein
MAYDIKMIMLEKHDYAQYLFILLSSFNGYASAGMAVLNLIEVMQ